LAAAILHIGAHKTGTTAIQLWLHLNRLRLAQRGLLYPAELMRPDNWMLGQHSIVFELQGRPELSRNTRETDQSPLAVLAGLPRTQDLLLSSENFSRLKDAEVAALARALAGYDVRVVLYVRRQDDTLQANYQTRVVNYGYAADFETFAREWKRDADYLAIARRWRDAFGPGSVVVRVYEKGQLKDNDAIADFTATLEDLLGRRLDAADWEAAPPNVNSSLPRHVVDVIRRHNTLPAGKALAGSLRDLSALLYQGQRFSHDYAPPDERARLLASRAEENQALAREFLGRADGVLFRDTAVRQSREEWDRSAGEDGLQRLLSDVLQALRQRDADAAARPNSPDASGWIALDACRDLRQSALKLGVESWIDLVGESCEKPTRLGGLDLPGAPPAEVQAAFVGSSGRAALKEAGAFYQYVLAVLAREGIGEIKSLMDFGCGWGRFTRLFRRDVAEDGLYGVDPWSYAINLCRAYYPFASFVQSGALPPLPFRDGLFDAVVSYSVFSHLREDAATAWIGEIARVLRPGGLLVAATHKPQLLDKVAGIRAGTEAPHNAWEADIARAWGDTAPLKARYDRGEFVFIEDSDNAHQGPGYGNAFIPEPYVRRAWGRHLEPVEYHRQSARIPLDVFVLKKTRGGWRSRLLGS